MKIKIIKVAKWISLISSILLFAYRMYITNTSNDLSEKYYDGSGVKYDSSKEGLIVSILTVVMFVIYVFFRAADEMKKKSKRSECSEDKDISRNEKQHEIE